MTRALIIVRLDRDDTWSREACFMYAGIAGHDVAVCADNAEKLGGVETPGGTRLLLDTAKLQGLGLYAHPQHTKRCRDYALYAARQQFPQYQHYWLIDSDTRINTHDAWDFFGRFAASEADLLAVRLGERPANWPWGRRMRPGGGAAQGCLLPIVRLSARAADGLLAARQAASADPALATPPAWPNDEAFVATTVADLGLAARDLNADGTPAYTEQSVASGLTADAAWLLGSPPDGLIYHPVRRFDDWLQEAEAAATSGPRHLRSVENPAGVRTMDGAAQLDRLGHSCLRIPAFSAASFVPLMLAEGLWRTRPWAGPDAAPDLDGARRRACLNSLERRFGVSGEHKPLGTAHAAICRLSPNNVYGVKPQDFDMGAGLPIGQLPRAFALPYAYDLAARDLLLTLHMSLDEVLARPFLYTGQRELARVIARIPLANMPRIYGDIDPVAKPVLVFSLGRTGSTLLQKLIGCVTPRSFSEPDTWTQLAEAGPQVASLSWEERRVAIYYAIAPLFHVRLPGGVDGRCVIKLRSQANGLAQDIARTFPAAKYVFMLREKRAWARSTYRSFGMTPVAAANRLLQAFRGLRHLQHNRVDLTLISYEDVIADPLGTTARLTGADPARNPALAARIAAVAGSDSQAGHALSRTHSARGREDEAAWLAAFEEKWAEIRPDSVLKQLKLDF